jgi:hypothetical protein
MILPSAQHLPLFIVYFKGTWVSFYCAFIFVLIMVNMQNGFDVAFSSYNLPSHSLGLTVLSRIVTTFCVYAFLRVYGVYYDSKV